MGIRIITQKLLVPTNKIAGVESCKEYPLKLFVMYDSDNNVVGSGLCPGGAMEKEESLNVYASEEDGQADGYNVEMPPIYDPTFVTQYDKIATRVELS